MQSCSMGGDKKTRQRDLLVVILGCCTRIAGGKIHQSHLDFGIVNGSVEATHNQCVLCWSSGGLRQIAREAPHSLRTVRKSSGWSPFYAVHEFEPLLPFDIIHSAFLLPTRYPLKTTTILPIHILQEVQITRPRQLSELTRQSTMRQH
jgi:hypothetical protein